MSFKEVKGRIGRHLRRLSRHKRGSDASPSQPPAQRGDTSTQETSQLSSSYSTEDQLSLDQAAAVAVPLPPSPSPRSVTSDYYSSLACQTRADHGDHVLSGAVKTAPGKSYRVESDENKGSKVSSDWATPRSSASVDYTTHMRPAVVEEHIRPHIHTVHHIERTRSIHIHEHHYRIQPIIETSESNLQV